MGKGTKRAVLGPTWPGQEPKRTRAVCSDAQGNRTLKHWGQTRGLTRMGTHVIDKASIREMCIQARSTFGKKEMHHEKADMIAEHAREAVKAEDANQARDSRFKG